MLAKRGTKGILSCFCKTTCSIVVLTMGASVEDISQSSLCITVATASRLSSGYKAETRDENNSRAEDNLVMVEMFVSSCWTLDRATLACDENSLLPESTPLPPLAPPLHPTFRSEQKPTCVQQNRHTHSILNSVARA